MTPEKLAKANQMAREIKALEANLPGPKAFSGYGSGDFVVSPERIPKDVYVALHTAYEDAMQHRISALKAEFEAL